jgi:HEAT repeat protein
MKRALVSLLAGFALVALLFAARFYAGGYYQPQRSFLENLGDQLFLMYSYYMEETGKVPEPTPEEVRKALARLDPRCHHEVRERAEWRLGTFSDGALHILLPELSALSDSLPTEPEGSENRHRLRAIVDGLAVVKANAAVPRLLEILQTDQDPWVRSDVLGALGKIGDPRAIPALSEALRTAKERDAALEALSRIGGEATPIVIEELFRSADSRHALNMCFYLGETRDPRAVEALVSLLRHRSEDVRGSARAALDRMGPMAIAPVLNALETETNDFVRAHAIGLILDDEDARNERVFSALRNWMDDPGLGDYAAESLGKLGDPRALDALLSSGKGVDPDWVLDRLDASSGWDEPLEPGRRDLVYILLEHESPPVRKRALERIVRNGGNGDTEARRAVEKLFLDPDEGVRRHALDAAFTLDQWASVGALIRFIPSAALGRELRSEFGKQYVIGFSDDFLEAARAAHLVALVVSVVLGCLLLFDAVRMFEPYRFNLLALLLLIEGFFGDFWWVSDGYSFGRHQESIVGPYRAAIGVHLFLLLGFLVLRPERGPATVSRRFGRLGGLSLWVIAPSLLYYGTPALAEAFQKAAARGSHMIAFLALLLVTAFLIVEEYLVPWSLFPRSARIERILTGSLAASLVALLGLALGRWGRERWLEGDSDAATGSFLLALPLGVMFFVYLARTRPFAPPPLTEESPPPPPGGRLSVRRDGETLSIRLPGWRFLPRDRIQIRRGYVRRARTFAGAALSGGKWSRRLPIGERLPSLTSEEKRWLRARLGHDPGSLVEPVLEGLTLELKPFAPSRSENRLRVELLLSHGAERPWSPSDLDEAASGIAWRAMVNGCEADVSFSQRERETAIPPGQKVELHPRIHFPGPVLPGMRLEVSVSCRASERTVTSSPLVLEGAS